MQLGFVKERLRSRTEHRNVFDSSPLVLRASQVCLRMNCSLVPGGLSEAFDFELPNASRGHLIAISSGIG